MVVTSVSEHDINKFPQLSNEQILECEKCITEKELFEALNSLFNDKSPENDGFTKEFFETSWSELKIPFLSCILHSFCKEGLCTSQR